MKTWEDKVRQVVPYIPGEQPDKANMIKVNTNENPYPPSPHVQAAAAGFSVDKMKLYTDPNASELVETLADYYQVDKEQVFVGVGSDDVLALSFMTFFNSDKPILFPDITYSFYPVWANLFRIPYEIQPLDENLRIRAEDYKKECGGIVLANPNAPTSIYEGLGFIEEIVAANPDAVVIVDEAYIDYAPGPSALELIDKYDNLLVVQTFSKSRSLAGLRIGYAMGDKKLIRYLNASKHSFNSYTMNLPSIVYGVESVRDDEYFKAMIEKVINTRSWVTAELREMGFEVFDSSTNFVFASHPRYDASEMLAALKEKDIYVRYFPQERTKQYLRISIGTDEEMRIVLNCINAHMKDR